jgi:putative flippase GtrA
MTHARGSLAMALRFGMIGAGTALIYTAAFAALVGRGAATVEANVAAYGIAILFQFVGHRNFTFRAAGAVHRSAMRFAATNAFGLVFSAALASLLRDGLGVGPLATGGAVSVALAVINWKVMRLWVFRT